MAFDDENPVANAGLPLLGSFYARMGLAGIISSDKVRLGNRVGGPIPPTCRSTWSRVARASHINHLDVPRAGANESILP